MAKRGAGGSRAAWVRPSPPKCLPRLVNEHVPRRHLPGGGPPRGRAGDGPPRPVRGKPGSAAEIGPWEGEAAGRFTRDSGTRSANREDSGGPYAALSDTIRRPVQFVTVRMPIQ